MVYDTNDFTEKLSWEEFEIKAKKLYELKCDVNKIIDMTIDDMILYVSEVRLIRNNLYSCYKNRELYRDDCVKENNRDIGHEISIRVTKEIMDFCEFVMEKINIRIEEEKKRIEEDIKRINKLSIIITNANKDKQNAINANKDKQNKDKQNAINVNKDKQNKDKQNKDKQNDIDEILIEESIQQAKKEKQEIVKKELQRWVNKLENDIKIKVFIPKINKLFDIVTDKSLNVLNFIRFILDKGLSNKYKYKNIIKLTDSDGNVINKNTLVSELPESKSEEIYYILYL